MRQIEQIMGMPIVVDIPGCDKKEIFNTVFNRFREIDKKFSHFKKNSELSRYQRKELREDDLSAELKKIIIACKKAEKITGGYFSAYYSGVFEPSGYVKGWAINEAGKIIEKNRYKTYCIGAGGDILARSDGEKEWKIGVENPKDKKYLTSQVFLENGALATSGTYERGKHIINPKSGKPATELLSVTVAGPDIVKADILATAVCAEGLPGLIMVEELKNYEAMAVDASGDWYMTSGAEDIIKFL